MHSTPLPKGATGGLRRLLGDRSIRNGSPIGSFIITTPTKSRCSPGFPAPLWAATIFPSRSTYNLKANIRPNTPGKTRSICGFNQQIIRALCAFVWGWPGGNIYSAILAYDFWNGNAITKHDGALQIGKRGCVKAGTLMLGREEPSAIGLASEYTFVLREFIAESRFLAYSQRVQSQKE